MYGNGLQFLLFVDHMLDSEMREQVVEGEDSCYD